MFHSSMHNFKLQREFIQLAVQMQPTNKPRWGPSCGLRQSAATLRHHQDELLGDRR